MEIFWIVCIILATYFLLVFMGLRLVVPFMGFGPYQLPKELPQEIIKTIKSLKEKSENQSSYLREAYNFVSNRWHAGRIDTIFYAPLAFRKNLLAIWQKPGYAHCNTQNYLLFILLCGSKFFQPKDVKVKIVFFNFFIHQYLQVKVAGEFVDADPAGASIRGKKLGQHISWFG